jgi:hypothetical protein
MSNEGELIGLVTRSSSRGYVGAKRLPETNLPVFGAFCKAEAQQGTSKVIGVIYDISIGDDEFARQLAVAQDPLPKHLQDQQTRLVPVEISALSVGFKTASVYQHSLPPQPPISMAPVFTLPRQELCDFSETFGFISQIVNADNLPVDDLLPAALNNAANARPKAERRAYLLEAGRECARLLSRDLTRLETVIRGFAV